MTCEKPKNGNEESNDLFPINETPASTISNITVDQSDKSKEMLEDFVHDAISEIGSDNTPDELSMYSQLVDVLSTSERALIEQQNKEYDEALKTDQQKEQEKEKEKEIAREMELLKHEREARVLEGPHIEEDHVVVCVRSLQGCFDDPLPETIQFTVHRSTVLSDIIKQFQENKSLCDPNLDMVIQVSLSRVFIKVILHGEVSVTEEELMAELLKFVSIDEADTISECLSANMACNSDEFVDILSSYGVRQRPNNDNVREIFIKLAHKEIIQKPNYITERWSAVLQPLKEILTSSIDEIYLKLESTTRKVFC
ncbi:Hypothetical predicted protein [Paramuricea clavata]|uniref:Uncharacterized protein n=1 Tax=Paramuricea clavata TaxID=317549 RepID=A0A6S7G179_PARCT|nr:Hypothetical predicted protein [Paramuricea clavata]